MEYYTFSELLKVFRRRRKISQRELARRLGKHINTLGTWERGDCLPGSKGVVLELAKHLLLNEADTERLLGASLTTISLRWNVPYSRNPFFTGREQYLEQLHIDLLQRRSVALTGLGGIGKTQLVLEYIYRHTKHYNAILWINAETVDSILSSFDAVYANLQCPEQKGSRSIVEIVLRWLEVHKDWLLIYDNVGSISMLKPFLPVSSQGVILITTRLQTLEGLAYMLELLPLSQEESVKFLFYRSGIINTVDSIENLQSSLKEQAQNLAEKTSGVPLALDQIGAYIEQARCSMANYFNYYQIYSTSLLNERSEAADHPDSIVKTIMHSFERVICTNTVSADLLRICAFLAPDGIPEEILFEGARAYTEGFIYDSLVFDDALKILMSHSLIRRDSVHHRIIMHILVQDVLKNSMDEISSRLWAERTVFFMNAALPDLDYSNAKNYEHCLSHLLCCVQLIDDWKIVSLSSLRLLYQTSQYFMALGCFEEATALLQRCLHVREQILGPGHTDLLDPLGSPAELYDSIRKLSQQYAKCG